MENKPWFFFFPTNGIRFEHREGNAVLWILKLLAVSKMQNAGEKELEQFLTEREVQSCVTGQGKIAASQKLHSPRAEREKLLLWDECVPLIRWLIKKIMAPSKRQWFDIIIFARVTLEHVGKEKKRTLTKAEH